ncbi:MAG: M23 family metallopeptidase [bacterium]|nr:M23 family metallopeptidase [bacterium]
MFIRSSRHFIPLFLALIVTAGLHPFLACAGSSKPPLWPLPIEVNLTSSFCEYRGGHLHAGLDIKTWGEEGIPCRAVADGYVSRLRASPYGYGKVVYVTLYSGETVVYAHLAEFSPELGRTIRNEQIRADKYKVDVYYERDHIPVERGDILGYSGSTGAGAPHLHFEVRDTSQNPLNPLSIGWELEDRRRPEFRGVLAIPTESGSRVGGQCRIRRVELRRVDKGRYVATDTLVLKGRVGFGAYVIDRINNASGRLAPYRVGVEVDGVVLTDITLESFTYGHAGEVELAYEMGHVRRNKEYFLMLFKRRGETLWNRKFIHDGMIDTDAIARLVGEKRDVYTVTIRAWDWAGNVAVAEIPFRVGTEGDGEVDTALDEVPGYFFFEDLLSIGKGPVTLRAHPTGPRPRLSPDTDISLDMNSDVGCLRIEDLPTEVTAFSVRNGTSDVLQVIAVRSSRPVSVEFNEFSLRVRTDEHSLYSSAFVFLTPWDEEAAGENGLVPAGTPVRLGPASLAIKNKIEFRFETRAQDGREAVYKFDERKSEWRYAGSVVDGDSVVAGIGSPGVYRVMIDTDPPVISKPQLKKRRSYATKEQIPEIVIPIEDIGSGVADENVVIEINGQKQIARWDGYSSKFYIPVHEAANGRYDVDVVAFDNVGNTSKLISRIQVASPHKASSEEHVE